MIQPADGPAAMGGVLLVGVLLVLFVECMSALLPASQVPSVQPDSTQLEIRTSRRAYDDLREWLLASWTVENVRPARYAGEVGDLVTFGEMLGQREIAQLAGVRQARVRSLVAAGALTPTQLDGVLRFSPQDLTIARRFRQIRITTLRQVLPKLRAPLFTVDVARVGDDVVVRDEAGAFVGRSGQGVLEFGTPCARPSNVVSLRSREDRTSERTTHDGADDMLGLALQLEATSPDAARELYERVLQLSPNHVGAHVNLGRMHHVAGDFAGAEMHYRSALSSQPAEPVAAFNLGLVLEDQEQAAAAVQAFLAVIASQPDHAAAHLKLSHLYRRSGQVFLALKHQRQYRRLEYSLG